MSSITQNTPQHDYSAVPINALESLRLRLTQLTHSLNSMQAQLMQATLPSWPALHSQFNIILKQLISLSETIAHHADVLKRTVAYPLPEFPTLQQAGLLSTLLRKKPLPDVEEWITEGAKMATGVKIKMDEDFCKWAREEVASEVGKHEWQGFMTSAEIDSGQVDTEISNGLQGVTATPTTIPVTGELRLEELIAIMAQGVTALNKQQWIHYDKKTFI